MKKNDIIKERVLDGLNECLNNLKAYSENSIIPLLYVLSAHHAGHRVSIVSSSEGNIFAPEKRHIQKIESIDGFEEDILKSIGSSVSESYFEGQPAEIIYDFYSKYCEDIDEYYSDIKQCIMEYFSDRVEKNISISPTPKELTILMSTLLAHMKPENVYDPCAGLCSFFLTEQLSDVHVWGHEIDPIVKAVSDFYTDAVEMGSWCKCTDCVENWDDSNSCDALISDLPLGVRLRDYDCEKYNVKSLEEYVVSRFITSNNLNKAVLLVTPRMLFDSAIKCKSLRQTLCELNYIDMVISLPAGILPRTGIRTSIIVLNKNKCQDKVVLLNADDCIMPTPKHSKILDYDKILKMLNEERDCTTAFQRKTVVTLDDIKANDYNLEPSRYMEYDPMLLPGQIMVNFSDVATKISGNTHFEDIRGKVLLSNNLIDDITHSPIKSIEEDVDLTSESNLMKISCECIIFNMDASKFYIKKDNNPLFVKKWFNCYTINNATFDVEYFAHAVVSAAGDRQKAMSTSLLPKVDFKNLTIPIYPNIESQRNIVKRLYREEKSKLKAKIDELSLLGDEASGLIHNLGVTFTRIGAGIGNLRSQMVNETLESVNDNVQFALRLINATGADFSNVTPNREKVVLSDIVENYAKAWNNFGYNSFDLKIAKDNLTPGTKVMIDKEMFYTLLDCLLINAHQHGFCKQKHPDNQVIIELKGVFVGDDDYAMVSVSNNGNPLPDGFTLKDFCKRGVVGINSSQDGLGGYHVYTITHKHFEGKVSIDSDSNWLSFNVLLPIYLTSDNSKFENYECEVL